MADILTPVERSRHMAKVRRTNTKPEMNVRRAAHRLGYRFRLHRRDLPGTPDLVFPRFRKIIMVNGCFWHQHDGCKHARLPKSRLEYWSPKLARNKDRDAEVLRELDRLGWEVMTVWECQARSLKAVSPILQAFLCSDDKADCSEATSGKPSTAP